MGRLRTRVPEPGEVPPATFFDHVLPTVLRAAAPHQVEPGGRFAFSVSGDGGGTWTVDLAARSVAPGIGDADVTLALGGHLRRSPARRSTP
jgi:hypothetical protein